MKASVFFFIRRAKRTPKGDPSISSLNIKMKPIKKSKAQVYCYIYIIETKRQFTVGLCIPLI